MTTPTQQQRQRQPTRAQQAAIQSAVTATATAVTAGAAALVAALSAGISTAALAALVVLWLAYRKQHPNTPAEWWLVLIADQDLEQELTDVLDPQLRALWATGWRIGSELAGGLAGEDNPPMPRALLAQLAGEWPASIAKTYVGLIAKALESAETADEILAAVRKVLDDEQHAELVAITETTRARALASLAVYWSADIAQVDWQTTSGNPCSECLANEAQSPWPIGGVPYPPQHPHCQCLLVPAEEQQ